MFPTYEKYLWQEGVTMTKPRQGRVIFHIDMNCFYASVEMAYDPKLKGKPLAIAGNPEERKGIIVTSSYEAREKGIYTTMPLWQAKKLCPELVVMRPNFDRYRKMSREIFQILATITPIIQPVSIDEGYMDITETKYYHDPLQLAQNLQYKIQHQLDLPCSIGIGPNKFLAKMASDMKKPLGITVLRKRELGKTLWPLPVEEMYGVGEKTAEKLNKIGVHTIGDLAKRDKYDLTQLLGINGERLSYYANGNDHRPVDPEAIHDVKSIGSSQTLSADTTNEVDIQQLLNQLAKSVEQRMIRRDVVGLSIQLMVRYHNRKTITRSKKLQTYINDQATIFKTAKELFDQHWNSDPVRLLGVSVMDVQERKHVAKQLDLFTYEEENEQARLDLTIHKLKQKYGDDTFKQFESEKNTEEMRTSFQKDFLDDYRKT